MASRDDFRNSQARGRELTLQAVLLGLLLSVVMGAANVYLGLRVGMTVSASIPAAVVAMAILKGVLGKSSILEANLVQTSASAGESLAAGIIFTMPALVLVGYWKTFDFWTTTLIGFAGGLLGILFMIPMRRVFVVDNKELQFPEGLACAEVLRTGERREDNTPSSAGATTVFLGLAVGAAFKFLQSYVGLLKGTLEWGTIQTSRVFYFGCDMAPALLGVGAIVGLPIAVQIFLGGALGWLIAIPIMSQGMTSGSAVETATELWSTQVRYMGVGAMVVGGLVSIWRVRAGLTAAVRELTAQISTRNQQQSAADGERNVGGTTIILLLTLTLSLIVGLYYSLLDRSVGITLLTSAIMVVMSFFFTAVASYIVGLVGNSNSPVSGMTITAVLATGGLIALFHWLGLLDSTGQSAVVATLCVAGIVCCVACTAGDVCNDLKTGSLVGASPRSQQIMQIGGVFVAAFVMAPVMTVLHEGSLKAGTGGIGGKDLPAPQAVLFSKLADGFFGDGKIPWDMVAWGAGLGVMLVIADGFLKAGGAKFRLHVMPVAVGIYLPLGLSVPILMGGVLAFAVRTFSGSRQAFSTKRLILAASGIIAGESLLGVLLGGLAYLDIPSLNLPKMLSHNFEISNTVYVVVSLVAFLCVAGWMAFVAMHADATPEDSQD